MKDLPEYLNEQKHDNQPLTFDIYNCGPKNTGFKLTIGAMWHKMDNFDQDMLLCPVAPKSLRYKDGTGKESTSNFTKMPEVVKYIEADSWHGWDNTLKYYLYYDIRPYIKHGKVSATIQPYEDDDRYVELVINDKDFNDERKAKITELEDPKNLEIWKKAWEESEKRESDRREAEEKAKQDYEEWKKNLTDEERKSREMGYGPHHSYEKSHPWDSPGCWTGWGWYTGD